MSTVLTVALMWSMSGLITAAILARHGHNLGLFALMGFAYGPLLLLLWFRAVKGQPTTLRPIEPIHRSNGSPAPLGHSVSPSAGWIDVLIGLDGSDGSVRSTKQLLDLLGPAVGRVRLTSVLDHEVSNAPDQFTADDRRIEHLRRAAIELGVCNAELALASGQPDKALVDQAQSENFDLLLVAHQRHPIVSLIRGSTSGRLARSADLPVLIGPAA